MDPVVDNMANLLSSVTTVITSFVSWLSSLTTALISNDIVVLIFAIGIIFAVTKFLIGLIKTASGRRKGKSRR